MRPISAELFRETQKLVSDGVFTWLLRIADPQDAVVFRLVNNAERVVFDGEVYEPYPFKVSSYEEDGSGQLSSLSISLSNVTRDVSRALEDTPTLVDGKALLVFLNLSHPNPEDSLQWQFFIKSAQVSEKAASLELNNSLFFDWRFPLRKFRRKCPFVYKGPDCQYAGDLASCDRSLLGANGCVTHGLDEIANALPLLHPLRYGGFPGILKS